MEIVVTLDVMLATRKVRSKELAEFVGITETNLSLLEGGKVKGTRFETLVKICGVLGANPGHFEGSRVRRLRQVNADHSWSL